MKPTVFIIAALVAGRILACNAAGAVRSPGIDQPPPTLTATPTATQVPPTITVTPVPTTTAAAT